MKFEFISNNNFREILERDFEELNICVENNCLKSVLLLSGSIIEAILIDYFIHFPIDGYTQSRILKMDLSTLIDKAYESNLITSSTKDLSIVIKNYRNLIHPGREIRTSQTFDKDTSDVAKSVLNMIVKEIRENYLNKIGYTSKDLILKLESDHLSKPIFEKILSRVHVSERNKLFIDLVEYETSRDCQHIVDRLNYLRILKPLIQRDVIEKALKKIIKIIESGENWVVISYYKVLYDDLKILDNDDIEFILLYIINTFFNSLNDVNLLYSYTNFNLIGTLGYHFRIPSIKKEIIEFAIAIVNNSYQFKNHFYYYVAYEQLILSISLLDKELVESQIKINVSNSTHESFYDGYNNGNYLPF